MDSNLLLHLRRDNNKDTTTSRPRILFLDYPTMRFYTHTDGYGPPTPRYITIQDLVGAENLASNAAGTTFNIQDTIELEEEETVGGCMGDDARRKEKDRQSWAFWSKASAGRGRHGKYRSQWGFQKQAWSERRCWAFHISLFFSLALSFMIQKGADRRRGTAVISSSCSSTKH